MGKKISGWSRIYYVNNLRLKLDHELHDIIKDGITVIPRGSGMAYGDVALNSNGYHYAQKPGDITQIGVNELLVSAGTCIGDVLNFALARNQTLYVVPGSRFISIGGAIASDIHGKNHVARGTFSNYISEITLNLDGINTRKVTKDEYLFWLTSGAMGLTGYIENVVIQTREINCPDMRTMTLKTDGLHETFQTLMRVSADFEYLIAWSDLQNNKKFGRSIIYASNQCDCNSGRKTTSPKLIRIPKIPFNILTQPLMKLYNGFRYANESKFHNTFRIQSPYEVLFPSDLFRNWTNLFGKNGLMEYQFVFPKDKVDEAIQIIEQISQKVNPTLAAVKLFGSRTGGIVSFPQPGFVFGVTFPWNSEYVSFLREMDKKLVKIGAKKYFSKDQLTESAILEYMYPEIDELRNYRIQANVQKIWQSDFSRRMNI